MIFVTGDCHMEYQKFNMANFPEQKNLTREDYMIICGDFGLWDDSKEQRYWLDWLSNKSFTLLFVDGNHENFHLLNSYEITKWHGGKIHRIRENLIHLMRGQVYEIDQKKIFTFGGAQSHDVSGGILDPLDSDFKTKKRWLNKENLPYRVKGLSWWEEEMPSKEEYEEGFRNLSINKWKVDYIITHCCSSNIQATFGHGLYKKNELTNYLEEVLKNLTFKKHYFGHYHDDRAIGEKYRMMFNDIKMI